jgi:hypothetical protein
MKISHIYIGNYRGVDSVKLLNLTDATAIIGDHFIGGNAVLDGLRLVHEVVRNDFNYAWDMFGSKPMNDFPITFCISFDNGLEYMIQYNAAKDSATETIINNGTIASVVLHSSAATNNAFTGLSTAYTYGIDDIREHILNWDTTGDSTKTPSLRVFECPENGVYPLKIDDVMKEHRKSAKQIIFTTYSPLVLNTLNPEEVVITCIKDGKIVALRPLEYLGIQALLDNGGKLGDLWYEGYMTLDC